MTTFTLQTGLEIDGQPLDPALEPLVEQVTVDDYLHLPDMFVLTFRDVDRTVLGTARLRIGSTVRVTATSVGGIRPEPLIDGEVTAIEAEYAESGSRVVVRGYDPSHRLHRGRRTRSFVGMKDSDIAKQIARGIGVELGTIDDSGPVVAHVGQANATDWDFLAGRAREIGFELAVADGRLHFRRPADSGGAPPAGDYDSADPLQLVFGKELLAFHPRLTSSGQVKEVVVRSWDPASKSGLVARAPAAASSASLGSTPAALAATFGDPTYVSIDRPFASQAAADAAARAIAEQIGSGFVEASGLALGHPKLKPGTAVQVSVVDQAFEGAYVITGARHVFDAGGYRTWFTVSGRQDRSLLSLASAGGASAAASTGTGAARMNGVAVGIVTVNDDPERLARVKLRFPWLSDDYESDWAPVASLGAGPDSGAVWLPNVNDAVLVAFEHGDVQRPYVLAGVWNGVDKPLLGDGLVDNGAVQRRAFVSRAGHRLTFLDGEAGRPRGITLETEGDGLRIALSQTDTEILVASDGTIRIEARGDLAIKSDTNVTVEAGVSLTLKGATIKVAASGPVDIDGALIQLN